MQVHKIDVDKLKTVRTHLSRLSNVVDNDVVKKAMYDKMVTKINAIDTKVAITSKLVSKTV